MYALVIILLMSCCPSLFAQAKGPVAHDGIILLPQAELETRSFKLKGEWWFYWNRHLTDSEITSGAFLQEDHFLIKTNSPWAQVKPGVTKDKGFATLVLRIDGLSANTERALGVQVGQFAPYHETLIYRPKTGELLKLGGAGVLTQESSSSIPQSKKLIAKLPALDNESIYLIQRVASYMLVGNFAEVPLLAPYAKLEQSYDRQIWEAFWVLGMFSLLVISNLSLYLLRREDTPSLLMSLFALIMGVRYCCTEGLYSYFYATPSMTLYIINQQVIGLAFPLGLAAYFHFMALTFPGSLKPWLIRSSWALCLFYTAFSLIMPEPAASLWFFFVMPFFLTSLYMLGRMVQWTWRGERGAGVSLLGIFLLIAAMVNDTMVWMDNYNFIYIGHYGMIAFIFAQSLVVASHFADAFRTADTLSKDLQREVERQTRDVKTILRNIQQGIFTVRSELKVGDDYSHFLKEILETETIKDRNALELVFAQTDLTSEQKDLIHQILTGSIAEPSLNFSLNSDHLPRELRFHLPDGRVKDLLVDWDPVIDEKRDVIEKMLVTLRDVTAWKAMEETARVQKRDMELIGEILEVPPERFDQFLRSSQNFLKENRRLIETATSSLDAAVLKMLFINMHTIKGAARTYHFVSMTAVVHDCEQNLAQIQRNQGSWDQARALEDLSKVEAVFADYERIHREKLKRSDGRDSVRIDLETIREHIKALDALGGFDLDSTLTPFVDQVRRTFFNLYYNELSEIFEDILKSLPTLARDLQKAEPQVHLYCQGIGVNAEAEEALRNVFVHVLRNIMDHGLESSGVRLAKGKPERGSITISCTWKSIREPLSIEVKDDGQGLALDKIAALAEERGLIDGTQSLSPEGVAELVFQDGFSTSKSVTDISGRGVGMSAVREFIQKLGGDVRIHLPTTPKTLGATPFVLKITLPPRVWACEEQSRGSAA